MAAPQALTRPRCTWLDSPSTLDTGDTPDTVPPSQPHGQMPPTGRPVTKGHVVAQSIDTPTVTLLSPHIWGPSDT